MRAFLGGLVAIVRDGEGRLVVFLDGLTQRAQALVFGRGGQRPIDAALAAVCQHQFVQAVLFVEFELGFEFSLAFSMALTSS